MCTGPWRQSLHTGHGGAQAGIGKTRQHALHVVFGASAHGVPLRPVGDLDQAVVVAEADHRGDGELQHLVCGTGPVAANHRQEVAVAKRRTEAVAGQKVADRLCQMGLGTLFGQPGGEPVEPHDVGQHVPEARPQQVTTLGEDAVQVVAAPFQPCLRHLHGERHLRARRLHIQLIKQADQVRVGALVEDEEAGVNALGDAIKLDVDLVGMAAEMAACFKERDLRFRGQRMGHRQARNAGAG